MNKQHIFVVCTVVMMLFGSLATTSVIINTNQDVLQISVIFPPSSSEISHLSKISSVNEALDDLEVTFSNRVNFTRLYPKTITEGGNLIIQKALESIDLIIAIAGDVKGLNSVSDTYGISIGIAGNNKPEQNFLIIDATIFNPNAHSRSVLYLEHEGSFLVGVLAAMVSTSQILGFYGVKRNDIINRYKFGFYQGANFIGSFSGVEYEFLETYVDGSNVYNSTLMQLEQGADIIYAVAGDSNPSIFDAVHDFNDSKAAEIGNSQIYAIGSNSNQDFIKPGTLLTSMIKRIELSLTTEITNFVNDNWVAGEEFLGIAGGHVGITNMGFTQNEKNAIEDQFNGQTRFELLQFLETAITNGEIIVSEDTSNSEINIIGENPFIETKQNSDFVTSNRILFGSLLFLSTVLIALYVSRERILRLTKKSDKSKAIDYLDRAKKIAEEPED
ncbi:MAG: BMP family ABC transporter substrate-binding protein [Candidatus Heimdallarchaeota archaeon]|nr:BMP family ABC transporter substrate-binding protein [Candidatus Heimdallarchaeota archaeon]